MSEKKTYTNERVKFLHCCTSSGDCGFGVNMKRYINVNLKVSAYAAQEEIPAWITVPVKARM
jgi:hypothetical protein